METEFQDWTPVVLTKRHFKQVDPMRKKVNIARRLDIPVTTTMKYDAGKNRSDTGVAYTYLHKVEDEEEVFSVPKVGLSFRLRLQKARQAKNLTQKELASRLNVKASIIQDYESGKIVPNNALISKMERILEAKLRDKRN